MPYQTMQQAPIARWLPRASRVTRWTVTKLRARQAWKQKPSSQPSCFKTSHRSSHRSISWKLWTSLVSRTLMTFVTSQCPFEMALVVDMPSSTSPRLHLQPCSCPRGMAAKEAANVQGLDALLAQASMKKLQRVKNPAFRPLVRRQLDSL
eukprot:5602960-Amphidinium_carterae.1